MDAAQGKRGDSNLGVSKSSNLSFSADTKKEVAALPAPKKKVWCSVVQCGAV